MNKQDFLIALQDMLQCEIELHGNTVLADLEEWDSLAFMVLIAFFDKNFGQRIVFEDLTKCRDAASLIALANGAIA